MRGRGVIVGSAGAALLAGIIVLRISGRRDVETPVHLTSARSTATNNSPQATPLSAATANPGTMIGGTIIHATTRAQVPNARISLQGPAGRRTTTGDAEGRFTFPSLPIASYALSISLHDCGWRSTPRTVVPGPEPLTLEIDGLHSVRGRVVTWDGKPVPPFKLRTQYSPGLEDVHAISASEFQVFIDPSHDRIELSAEAAGYVCKLLSLEMKGDVEGVELVLSQGGVLAGSVVDDAGRPLEGARVDLKPSKTLLLTEADGRFVSPPLAAGTYGVHARKKGYVDAILERVALGEGTTTLPVTLTLRRGWSVRGTVSDTQGRPIAGAWVRSREGIQSLSASTAANGRFEIAGIEPGAVELNRSPQIDLLEAGAKGFGPLTLADVPDGGDLTITLLGAATLTLRVRGAEGPLDPELNWTANLLLRQPQNVQDRSAALGYDVHLSRGASIVIPNLAPGLYEVEVSAPGWSSFKQDGVRLSSGQTATLDVTLLQGKNETPILGFDSSTPEAIRKKLPALLGGFTDQARDDLMMMLRELYPEGTPNRAAIDAVLLQFLKERK